MKHLEHFSGTAAQKKLECHGIDMLSELAECGCAEGRKEERGL